MSETEVPTTCADAWQTDWFIGGHVALDLVNTVPWRLDLERSIDRLPDVDALIQWAHAVELIDARRADRLRAEARMHPVVARTVAREARQFREQLYLLLQPLAVGTAPESTPVEAVRHAVIDALGHAQITTVVPMRWVVPIKGLRDLLKVLALSAWRLLQFDDLTRLRQCRDSGCGWLFMDRSKNHSRVWCSSADCGNRNRARHHYQRRRGG